MASMLKSLTPGSKIQELNHYNSIASIIIMGSQKK